MVDSLGSIGAAQSLVYPRDTQAQNLTSPSTVQAAAPSAASAPQVEITDQIVSQAQAQAEAEQASATLSQDQDLTLTRGTLFDETL